jgi:tRNA pseudouridine38-40 synthase
VASFTVADAIRGSSERHLFQVSLVHRPRGLDLHFVGGGFLRYQVRRMVGAVLEVGWGQRSVSEFGLLLAHPRPGTTMLTAPARGLTLERVYYRRSPRFEPR